MSRPPLIVLHLSITSDLSRSSFEWARGLLKEKNDLPLLLIAAPGECNKALSDWLWDNSRVTTLVDVPVEILVDPTAWAVQGYNYVVVSLAPEIAP